MRFQIIGKNQKEYGIEGIIDTGFTGFAQIPLIIAVAIGIRINPAQVAKSTLANGVIENILVAQISVKAGNEVTTGLCHMPSNENCPVLIGMEFLRKSNRVLVVSSKVGIHLVKESEINFVN